MIRLWDTSLTNWDANAVAEQVRSGMIGCGSVVAEFESKICEIHGVKHCIATTSGTTALLLSLMALDLPAGSTIAFPAYGMLAGANAARLLGLNVRLADVFADNGLLHYRLYPKSEAACIFINGNGLLSQIRERDAFGCYGKP